MLKQTTATPEPKGHADNQSRTEAFFVIFTWCQRQLDSNPKTEDPCSANFTIKLRTKTWFLHGEIVQKVFKTSRKSINV